MPRSKSNSKAHNANPDIKKVEIGNYRLMTIWAYMIL